MASCQHSSHQVMHHAGVLVLAAVVIRVQVETTLANTVAIEEVVQHRPTQRCWPLSRSGRSHPAGSDLASETLHMQHRTYHTFGDT